MRDVSRSYTASWPFTGLAPLSPHSILFRSPAPDPELHMQLTKAQQRGKITPHLSGHSLPYVARMPLAAFAGSWSPHVPGHPGPFLQSCSPACACALGCSSRDKGLGHCQTPGSSWGCSAPSEQQHNSATSPQSGTVCNPAEGAP